MHQVVYSVALYDGLGFFGMTSKLQGVLTTHCAVEECFYKCTPMLFVLCKCMRTVLALFFNSPNNGQSASQRKIDWLIKTVGLNIYCQVKHAGFAKGKKVFHECHTVTGCNFDLFTVYGNFKGQPDYWILYEEFLNRSRILIMDNLVHLLYNNQLAI